MMQAMLLFDQWWWLILPGFLLGLYAQMRLTSTYNKYSEVPTHSGRSGAEAAREILDNAGLREVDIQEIPGQLTDHYDPTKRALFLSSDNFHGRTLAAVGVSAHESGHALQHQAAYPLLNLRMALVPMTNFASTAAIWLSIGGWMLGFAKLAWIGVAIYAILSFFHLVTLPVEYDASRRAKDQLLRLGLVDNQERQGVSKMLHAAALTYVAALLAAVMTLLHFVLLARSNDRD